ncbi:MAG: hypothetical protein D6722_07755 [Bacteroidetes bacterium]|nr:MAG: hypothetical protein D6722_07755 [Bacteroidota bacterium]
MLGEKAWPYEQIGGTEKLRERFAGIIWVAHQHLEAPLIQRALDTSCHDGGAPLPIQLLYPEP